MIFSTDVFGSKILTIILDGNLLKTISRDFFKNLKKLKILQLSENFIKTIDDKTFDDLVSLESLSLGEKQDFNLNF